MKTIFQIFLFILLTILTQIGGVVFILSEILCFQSQKKNIIERLGIFLFLYSLVTFFVVPTVAPIFGREKVQHTENIRPSTYLTILFNRNYVNPRLNELLQNADSQISNENIKISYLDACFPFFNGFPLLPHLSHNDGKKIDLSLIYENEAGEIVPKIKSISGYGVFESPKKKEFDQTKSYKEKGYFQYDYTKFLTLGKINQELSFSNKGNKILLQSILKQNNIGKIFLEPHLVKRTGLKNSKIRFQGCKAVRHDDHIHVQLK